MYRSLFESGVVDSSIMVFVPLGYMAHVTRWAPCPLISEGGNTCSSLYKSMLWPSVILNYDTLSLGMLGEEPRDRVVPGRVMTHSHHEYNETNNSRESLN